MSDVADVVYPKETLTVGWSGGRTTLRRGQPVAADHQLVREKPELFEGAPSKPAGRSHPGTGSGVETATRAPGEKRRTRKPRRTGQQW